MGAFDFDVIARSFVYLFKEGMTFTLTLDRALAAGRHRLRDAARDDAAVVVQVAARWSRPATST